MTRHAAPVTVAPQRLVVTGLAVVTLALLSACGSSDPGESGAISTTSGARSKTSATAPASTAASGGSVEQRIRTLGQKGIVVSPQSPQQRLANGLTPLPGAPLFEGDYADPFVLAVGPKLYLYTTNTVDANVPVLVSAAGVMAAPEGDALPKLPSWTKPGLVWAPSVLHTSDGYVLYYTSHDTESGHQCIGAAFSTTPQGPFVDDSDEAFVCQRDLGGTIDASPLVADDGTTWLVFKNDGNCCGITTRLWIQQLSADGRKVHGQPVSLLKTDEAWEGPLIEGPSMIQSGDHFWLFYSANDWDTASYATGVARCDSPTGPCSKMAKPFMVSHGDASGPGGAETFTDIRNRHWIVYHAWVNDKVGYQSGGTRSLFAVPLDVTGDEPVATGLSD